MNDTDLELLARRSAAVVRDEAARIAATDSAWHRLLGAQPPADLGDEIAGSAAIVHLDSSERTGVRRTWAVFAAAAGLIALVAGTVLAFRGDGDGTIGPAETVPSTDTRVPDPTEPPTVPPTSSPVTTVPLRDETVDEAAVVVDNLDSATGPVDTSDDVANGADGPPGLTGADGLAALVIPEFPAPDLDDVPRLIPGDLSALGDQAFERREVAGDPATAPTLSQLWVRSPDGVRIDATVAVTSWPVDVGVLGPATPVDVPSWTAAYHQPTDPSTDIVALLLLGDQGRVRVSTTGQSLEDAIAIAGAMQLRSDSSGWDLHLDRADGWIPIESTWNAGQAVRTIIARSALTGEPSVLELTVTTGVAVSEVGMWHEWGSTKQIVDIGGVPALLYDDGVALTSLKWTPEPGVAVVIGSRTLGSGQLIALARSLIEVDQGTWETFSSVDQGTDDGCDSMFC